MQAFSVGTCLGDAFEALVGARVAVLLAVLAAAPLVAVALAEPTAALVALPVLDVIVATITTVGVVAALYDRRPSPGRVLVAALRRLPSAALLMIVIYVVLLALGFGAAIPLLDDDRWRHDLVLGLIMLTVWALFAALLYTRWFVAIPASVIEYRGAVAALRRSDRLTRGHRALLFAILALLGTLTIGALAVLEVRLTSDAVVLTIAVLGAVPATVIRAAIAATAYAQLRAATEAGDPERLADVFG